MTMAHLYNSRAAVKRLHAATVDGSPSYEWVPVDALQYLACRFDVGLLRPGKDQPMPIEAGKAPPRFGVLFADSYCGLLAGDRLTFVPNDDSVIPVSGTFEMRVPPDEVQDMGGQHHIEVQLIEVAQGVAAAGNVPERAFPGSQ